MGWTIYSRTDWRRRIAQCSSLMIVFVAKPGKGQFDPSTMSLIPGELLPVIVVCLHANTKWFDLNEFQKIPTKCGAKIGCFNALSSALLFRLQQV